MKVVKFLVAFIFSLFFMVGNCLAESDILSDMYANPKNYISIGSAGTGLTMYVSKSSLDVQEYAPQKYIISIRWAMCSFHRIQENGVWKDSITAEPHRLNRYLYDYSERKIYVEERDANNNLYWEYLDPQFANSSISDPRRLNMISAEFAFYWAYNQSFFDKPVSDSLRRYIETGKGTFDDR